ncbi:DDB1- and CUL4-associated factor 4-like [Papaver somniferum]|uniref:DDB1- and CUL4-associated factor 4-like n=1 Tax=Papaver somniferum TaxID=3469 RepID=UPI000E7040AA|nr:DDB1- and CUL4-associated factor 4-like [Papaver somniferum]
MPRELPGFYFDPEKNRYFAIKGPIPGFSNLQRPPLKEPDKQPNEQHSVCSQRKGIRTANLLQFRELYGGKVAPFGKGRCSFQHEYQKNRASQPMIWKYKKTDMIADSALEQLRIDIQTPEGENEANGLLMGSTNGSLSFYEVSKDEQDFDYGIKCTPDFVWPLLQETQAECSNAPGHIWRPAGASEIMPSHISCIQRTQKHSLCTPDDGPSNLTQHALITTLGSDTSGGSLYMLNLSEPLDLNPTDPVLRRRITKVASVNCTIWTADCNTNGSEAVIGTNVGATLVNLETGAFSWLCRCRSDLFSLKFDHSGNIIICGFRNGAIVTVDVRQKQGVSAGLPRHQIPYSSCTLRGASSINPRKFSRQMFELRGNIRPSCTTSMSSSISSLVALQTYDQYFLASTLDGSIKLYDHRLTQRGAVQSYEGQVNSHTHIQLGVDPSESVVMSGGEDGYVRIWGIKTAQLLFSSRISSSAPAALCWPGIGKQPLPKKRRECEDDDIHAQIHSWGAWLGSKDGLFHVQGL